MLWYTTPGLMSTTGFVGSGAYITHILATIILLSCFFFIAHPWLEFTIIEKFTCLALMIDELVWSYVIWSGICFMICWAIINFPFKEQVCIGIQSTEQQSAS